MEQENIAVNSQQDESNGGLSFRGLIEVFYKPTAFFNRLKDNPKVLVVYIALTILTFAFWWIVKDIFVQTLMELPEFRERLGGQELTPQIRNIMGIGQAVQNTLFFVLGPLVAALLAWFWGNVVMAAEARFKQLLSVMLYGELIYAIGNLLTLPMILTKKSIFVSMSLGALAPEKSFTNPLYLILSKLDIFLIWEIIIIGIGLAIVFNFSRNKGYLLSVISMGLLSIFGVVWAIVSTALF